MKPIDRLISKRFGTLTPTLEQWNDLKDALEFRFRDLCESAGADQWTWHRAVAAIEGKVPGDRISTRRNEDTSRDAELAGNAEIRDAWNRYIVALHAYYLLRDGPNGALGGRGL